MMILYMTIPTHDEAAVLHRARKRIQVRCCGQESLFGWDRLMVKLKLSLCVIDIFRLM